MGPTTASSIQNPPSDSGDRSALQKLMRKLTGMPVTLKELYAADKNHHQQRQSTHSADMENSSHRTGKTVSIRKFIPNLFLPNPPLDPNSQVSAVDDANDGSNDSSTRQIILESFLKNNGGYLDDSESSATSSDLDDERTTNEDHQDQHIQQGYNINIVAKKHPSETSPDQPSGTAPKNSYHSHQSISHTLPKRLLQLHLTSNKPDHRIHPATILLNKSDYEACHPFVNSADFQHHNSQECYHRNCTVKPLIDHLENSHAVKLSPERCDRNASAQPKPRRGFKNRASQEAHPEAKGCTGEQCCGDVGDCESKEGEDEAAESVNLKYIRCSTFPTKNSILHSHPRPEASSSSHSSSLNLDQTSSTSQRSSLRHHAHLHQFKSPFRNLVLGHDDLLRSN